MTPNEETILKEIGGREISFDQITKATGMMPWELTSALAGLAARDKITSRVDLSTGKHVRLYRAL